MGTPSVGVLLLFINNEYDGHHHMVTVTNDIFRQGFETLKLYSRYFNKAMYTEWEPRRQWRTPTPTQKYLLSFPSQNNCMFFFPFFCYDSECHSWCHWYGIERIRCWFPLLRTKCLRRRYQLTPSRTPLARRCWRWQMRRFGIIVVEK